MDGAMIARHVEAALRRTGAGETVAQVQDEVAGNRAWVLRGERSTVILRPNGSDLHVWLASGDLAELMDMEDATARVAKEIGFTRMTIEGGRKGWARVLKMRGWTADGNTLVRTL